MQQQKRENPHVCKIQVEEAVWQKLCSTEFFTAESWSFADHCYLLVNTFACYE